MTDIELVIKVPQDAYDLMQKRNDLTIAERVIANGKPLPKGHGRLIDADIMWDSYHSNDYDFYEALDDAPTIIPADKESE